MASILLVEDEPIIASQLEKRLTIIGHTVVGHASDGMESISMAKQSMPDLILMDIIMPGEIDGIQAAEIIIRDYDIPIIFLTALGDDETVSRAKATNPYAYILKPYHMSEVTAAIDVALHRKAQERELLASEEQMRHIVECHDDVFMILVGEGIVRYANAAALRLFGGEKEQVTGTPFSRLFVKIDENTVSQHIAALLKNVTEQRAGEVEDSIIVNIRGNNDCSVKIRLAGRFSKAGPFICVTARLCESKKEDLVAICSHCKKVRCNDEHWEEIESFLTDRLNKLLTHSICPACIKQYYPDLEE
jgi:DNA-binding response OmpR family regulator